jgi:hypothetical protein
MARRSAQLAKHWRFSAIAAAGTLAVGTLASVSAAAAGGTLEGTPPLVSASPSATTIAEGEAISIAGSSSQAGRPLAGAPLELQADPYPFHGYATIAHTVSAADGSYTFNTIKPDENVRLRVSAQASPAVTSQQLTISVEPTVAINASSEGPGHTRLSIRLTHTTHGGSPPVQAQWFVARRGSSEFRLADTTPTRELSPGLTYTAATVDPPSRQFVYRVCLSPSWEDSMARPHAHLSCPQSGDGELAYGAEGQGVPLAAYPSPSAVAAGVRFLDGRAGRTSLAVVNSAGELSGVNLREHFETASVVKVMMLVAFLQKRNAEHRSLDEADRALLYPMIHISDNEAASAVYGIVGEPAVARVARESGMQDYAPGIGWWAYTQTSAADQARFFFALPHLIPSQFYAYARGLLAGIEPSQSWGFPPVARPAWQVFFKTGALPEEGLFNEVARLERPEATFTVAVLTDGDPSMSYGEQTIEGVAAALLAHSP